MAKEITNTAASVHARLLNQARAGSRSFNDLLQLYAMERFLHRLSRTKHADRFVLKGALLMRAWDTTMFRTTRDIDLLARASNEVAVLEGVVREACTASVDPDGLQFDPKSVRGETIVEDADYPGVRVTFGGTLGNARLDMSHQITVRKDGTEEFFSAGSTPVWHRLGQRTERAITSGAALRMAALDWKVEECPIHAEVDGGMQEITTHKSIVRRDTKAVLGVVGRRYKPVQNEEAFEWLDGLVGSRLAMYETAGSIRNGALVWALVRLPGELRIANTDDVVKPFILCVNSHDGSVAFRALNTSVRVVCSNTLTLALRNAGPDAIAWQFVIARSIHDCGLWRPPSGGRSQYRVFTDEQVRHVAREVC